MLNPMLWAHTLTSLGAHGQRPKSHTARVSASRPLKKDVLYGTIMGSMDEIRTSYIYTPWSIWHVTYKATKCKLTT